MELESEFGHVQVELDNSANGSRLMIKDLKSGQTIYLDPLELEGLAWARHGDLAALLDPGLTVARDSSPLALGRVDPYYVRHPQVFRQLSSSIFSVYLGLRRPVHSLASTILRREWA